MRLVAHLVRADLRRSWLPLAAWLVLAIVTAIIPCVIPQLAGGDVRLLSALELPVGLVAVAYPLVLLVLVVQVVQTHPLVGSSAFWMTRPIPPRVLFASKVILLGVAAVIVPMVIEIAQMTAHGVPWSTQAGVAIDTAVAHAFLLVAIMLGAGLTASFSRFSLLVGALLASLAALIAVLVVIGSRSSAPPTYAGWSHIPDPTPWLAQSILFIVAVGGALLMQYVMRSRVRTVAVATVGIAASMAVAWAWPWSWLQAADQPPAWARNTAALSVSVDEPSAIRAFSSAGYDDQRWIGVRGPLRVDGIDPQFTVLVGVAEASLRVGDGTLTSLPELYPVTIARAGEVLYPSLVVVPRAALDVDRLAVRRLGPHEVPTLFFGDAAEIQRYAPTAGDYRGRVRLVLQKHEIEATMPLTVSQVHQRGAHRIRIDSVDSRWGNVSVQVHESRAGSQFDRTFHPYYSYYLRNTKLREAVLGSGQPLGEAVNALRFVSFSIGVEDRQNGFRAREMLLRFVPDSEAEQTVVIDDAWLADAELVIVTTTRAGTVERDLEIANFPLSLPTRAGF